MKKEDYVKEWEKGRGGGEGKEDIGEGAQDGSARKFILDKVV